MNTSNRILVVENDKLRRKQTIALLIDAGYKTSQATNGEDAINILEEFDPDLALVNIHLPDMDGIEVCRRIKNSSKKNTFVILVSEKPVENNSQAEGLEFGADGYIVLPISDRELLARVQVFMRIKQAESALRLSEERYRTVYERLPIGYQSLDINGCLIDVNQAWLSILGYEREEVIGKWFGDFLITEHQDLFKTRFPMFKQIGEVHNVEFEMVRKDGSHITVTFEGKIGYNSQMEFKQTHCVLADISGRKEIENKIRESEEKFRNVFESANVGKSITSINGRITVNQALATMLGYSQEELIGQTWQSITPKEDIVLTQSHLDPLISGEEKQTRFTKRYFHKNGSIVYGDVSVTLHRDDKGTPLYFITTIVDISERIKEKQALNESNELLSTFIKNSPIYAFIKEVTPDQSRVITASENYKEMIGIPGSEMAGKTMEELYPPEFAVKMTADDWTVISQGKNLQVDETYNGRSYTSIKFPIKLGKKSMLAGYTIDITERKITQDELAESERRFREMFSTVKLITLILDEKGNITYCNDFLLDLIGWTREELVGKNWFFTCLPKRLQGEVHDIFLEAFKSGHVPPYHENEIITKSGEERIIFWNNVTFCDSSGRVIGSASIGSDITDRKKEQLTLEKYNSELEAAVATRTEELQQAQEQLIRNEKLAVLGQLAGGVGHELRNPLGVISNAVYYLSMVQPDADPKIKKYIQMIATETRNAEKIISDLLDFARIKSVDKVKVNFDELISYTLERRPSPEGIILVKNIPTELPEVDVDPKQIDQVLENLIVNAYQAMPDGGTLTISAEETVRVGRTFIKVTVKDTGEGITNENLPKMFEPLFTTKTKGIGLGLAVSKKLLEANEGEIEVKSEQGKGAEFIVYLPV